MTQNSIERLFRLKEEISSLESDPKVKSLLEKGTKLESIVSELDITEQTAAEMLVPQAVSRSSGPIFSLEGKRRIPINVGKKMLMQSNLLSIRSEIDELLAKLERDDEVVKRSLLLEALDELGISYMDAAELLSPGIIQSASKGLEGAKPNKRATRFWKNPHTEEFVKARSTANNKLRQWAYEHGKHILKDWLVDPEDAPKHMQD